MILVEVGDIFIHEKRDLATMVTNVDGSRVTTIVISSSRNSFQIGEIWTTVKSQLKYYWYNQKSCPKCRKVYPS